jgi:hypothetical protein
VIAEVAMGCPIHVWVPMMAALAPVARVARDRLQGTLTRPELPRPRDAGDLTRWQPVHSDSAGDDAAAEQA